MTAQTPRTPTRGAAAVRAVPRLVFEIRRTVGTVTTAGFGPGYASTEVVLLSTPALELQQELGVEAFAVLLILAMSAQEQADGQLVVEAPNPLVVRQTGWSRNKAARFITELEDAGFIARPERRRVTGEDGRLVYAKTELVLSSNLYQTVERRLTVATTERVTTAQPTTASSRSSGPKASSAPIRSSGRTSASNQGSGPEGAGQPTALSRSTAQSQHLHDDEVDDDVHSVGGENEMPAAGQAAAGQPRDRLRALGALAGDGDPRRTLAVLSGAEPTFTVEETRELGEEELIDLLSSWKVYQPARLVRQTPRPLLLEAVRAITSRWDEIDNPGAYLRSLLREGSRGAAPALRGGSNAPPRAVPSALDHKAEPLADRGEITAAMGRLPDELCAELERIAAAAVQADEHARRVRGLAAGVRLNALDRELRRRGLLEPPTGAAAGQ